MSLVTLNCADVDCEREFAEWAWLVPLGHQPILLGLLGDWITMGTDGSVWNLNLLEGDYLKIANRSADFNELKENPDLADGWLNAVWIEAADRRGIRPG